MCGTQSTDKRQSYFQKYFLERRECGLSEIFLESMSIDWNIVRETFKNSLADVEIFVKKKEGRKQLNEREIKWPTYVLFGKSPVTIQW